MCFWDFGHILGGYLCIFPINYIKSTEHGSKIYFSTLNLRVIIYRPPPPISFQVNHPKIIIPHSHCQVYWTRSKLLNRQGHILATSMTHRTIFFCFFLFIYKFIKKYFVEKISAFSITITIPICKKKTTKSQFQLTKLSHTNP